MHRSSGDAGGLRQRGGTAAIPKNATSATSNRIEKISLVIEDGLECQQTPIVNRCLLHPGAHVGDSTCHSFTTAFDLKNLMKYKIFIYLHVFKLFEVGGTLSWFWIRFGRVGTESGHYAGAFGEDETGKQPRKRLLYQAVHIRF